MMIRLLNVILMHLRLDKSLEDHNACNGIDELSDKITIGIQNSSDSSQKITFKRK